jgi:F-type H+-transporting ATPase subunit b
MATDTAVIVIAQAETGHTEAVTVGDDHTATHTTETLGEQNLEHAEAGMPQLDFAIFPNLIFWLVVAIVALYLILSRVALPRIGTVLAERTDAITGDIEMAALYKRRAEEAEAAYNAALARARDEAHRIAAEARAQIDKELSGVMAKADAEIAAKTAESEGRIRDIRDSAARSVEEVARDTAAEIVRSFLPGAVDTEAVDGAIAGRMRG